MLTTTMSCNIIHIIDSMFNSSNIYIEPFQVVLSHFMILGPVSNKVDTINTILLLSNDS